MPPNVPLAMSLGRILADGRCLMMECHTCRKRLSLKPAVALARYGSVPNIEDVRLITRRRCRNELCRINVFTDLPPGFVSTGAPPPKV